MAIGELHIDLNGEVVIGLEEWEPAVFHRRPHQLHLVRVRPQDSEEQEGDEIPRVTITDVNVSSFMK